MNIAAWLRDGAPNDVSYRALGQAANTALSFGPFWPGSPKVGCVRVRSNAKDATTQSKVGYITATDGTNVSNLYAGDLRYTSAGMYVDVQRLFGYTWECRHINCNLWVMNNVSPCTFDVEIVGLR